MVRNYRRFIFKFRLQLKLRLFICVLEKKKNIEFNFLVKILDAKNREEGGVVKL